MMQFHKGIYILLAAMAIEVSCNCGRALSDNLEDGIGADIFPWYVEIYKENGNFLEETCAGNLISRDVVVTAARCVRNEQSEIDTTRFFVVTGNNLPKFWSKTIPLKYQIKTFYRTIGYPAVPGKFSGDLVWLVLRYPLNFTSSFGPACIDLHSRQVNESLQAGSVGQVIYRSGSEITSSAKLRRMKIIPTWDEHCSLSLPVSRRQNGSPNPSCADLATEISFNHNFIGSGFYLQRNGRWYLRAIITEVYLFGFGDRTHTVALLMNVQHYADEINRSGIIKEECIGVGDSQHGETSKSEICQMFMTGCGMPAPRVKAFIIGGYRSLLGRFPWHVGVYRKNGTGFHEQICAGSLISTKVVISAAHCFYDEKRNLLLAASSFAIAGGKFHRLYDWPEESAQKSPVKSIHLPSNYYGVAGNYAEDIAWLILRHPFDHSDVVAPVCIDFDDSVENGDLRDGRIGKIAGWGRTAADVPSEELQEMHAPFIPHDRCIPEVPQDFVRFVTADKFCAGYLNGTRLCDGDSGGGLVFDHRGIWYLRGIVSVGPTNATSTCAASYTVFTNVGRHINDHRRIIRMSIS